MGRGEHHDNDLPWRPKFEPSFARVDTGEIIVPRKDGKVWDDKPQGATTVSGNERSPGPQSQSDDCFISGSEDGPTLVASSPERNTGGTISISSSDAGSPVRCVNTRLGFELPGDDDHRDVEERRASPTHQPAGDEGGDTGLQTTGLDVKEQVSQIPNRQLHCGSLYSETGRHQVEETSGRDESGIQAVPTIKYHTGRLPHSGETECSSGSGFQDGPNCGDRVASLQPGVQVGPVSLTMGASDGGLVCEQPKPTPGQIHVTMPRLESNSNRCTEEPVAARSPVLFPTDDHHGPGDISHTYVIIERTDAISGTDVPISEMVPTIASTVSSAADTTPATARVTATATLEVLPPLPRLAPPSPLGGGDSWLIQQGFSESVQSQLANVRNKATNAVYDSRWRKWQDFCKQKDRDPASAHVPTVAEFLLHCFQVENLSVKTVQGYKAALTAKLKPLTGVDLGKSDILSQLIHSFYRTRPPPCRRVLQWDVNVVLHFLKHGAWADTARLGAREITLKLVFLLSLATGKRCGEIHALEHRVHKVADTWDEIVLHPRLDFMGKTHHATKGRGTFTDIVVPSLGKLGEASVDTALCPVHTLRQYLQVSDRYRSPLQKRLIISWVQGRQEDISKYAISHYLRAAVVEAHQNNENVTRSAEAFKMRPHDIRGIATSLQSLSNCSMEDILRAGVWATPSTFLRHYVKEFTVEQLSGLSHLAPFVVGSSIFDNE